MTKKLTTARNENSGSKDNLEENPVEHRLKSETTGQIQLVFEVTRHIKKSPGFFRPSN